MSQTQTAQQWVAVTSSNLAAPTTGWAPAAQLGQWPIKQACRTQTAAAQVSLLSWARLQRLCSQGLALAAAAAAAAGQVSPYLQLNEDGQQYPIFYFDEFWLLRDKLVPMNDTLEEVPLHLSVKTQKFWWMQIQQQVGAGQGG